VKVAWLGRCATIDDAGLILRRQLEICEQALAGHAEIVTHFYDVGSGGTPAQQRGYAARHDQLGIPVPRDGGIADLLQQARRPDRRLEAVLCESAERLARPRYLATKIEGGLAQVGLVLLLAEEGIRPSPIITLTYARPLSPAITGWLVLNLRRRLTVDRGVEPLPRRWSGGYLTEDSGAQDE